MNVSTSSSVLVQRVSRGFDVVLLSGGKRIARWRFYLFPDRCELQDVPAGLGKWDELVRLYERCRASGTTITTLDEEIKSSAHEFFVHQRVGAILYHEQACTEARRSRFTFTIVVAKSIADPMDVDS